MEEVCQCLKGVMMKLFVGKLKGGKSPGVDEMVFEERWGSVVEWLVRMFNWCFCQGGGVAE